MSGTGGQPQPEQRDTAPPPAPPAPADKPTADDLARQEAFRRLRTRAQELGMSHGEENDFMMKMCATRDTEQLSNEKLFGMAARLEAFAGREELLIFISTVPRRTVDLPPE